MNRQEAKRIACREAAEWLLADLETAPAPCRCKNDDDIERFDIGMRELIRELRVRGRLACELPGVSGD